MEFLLIVIITCISSALWLKYLDHLDYYKKDKRTTRIVYIGLVAGILSIIPTFIFYEINWRLFGWLVNGPFLDNFLIVGFSEETAKYFMLIGMVFLFRSIKEPQDGILQGAAVGAGFAFFENIKYGLTYGPVNTIIRSVLTTPGHMMYTALAGYFLAAAVYSNLEVRDDRSAWIAVFAFIPTAFIHALYNASFDWAFMFNTGYNTLRGLGILINLVTLIITVQVFRSLIEHSPYFVYPYSRSKQAIRSILRGLKLNPSSFVLNRRLGLYYMAAGRYPEALRRIRYCRSRKPNKRNTWDALEGIALMGIGKNDEGLQLVTRARENFAKGERFRIEHFLQRTIRDAGLKLRMRNILNPRVFKHNHYFDRRLKYGPRDYWKSDSRILKERLQEYSELLREKRQMESR
ncbi:PrsW family glutamic-type intramembrane protease [Marispirochaeta sp.]|uniref:PrsW family glutamic-type intramembrane protease n=1 Tax=Marispirochaeta sp. TaxID=2038653 RepID=UPI0029C7B94B|nr:PrsW family glutamic-type intramembrane protease [Marispirochaeta sp.]